MTEEEIMNKTLNTDYIGRSFKWFRKVSSTNDYIKENAQSLADGFLCATTEQYAGKGRRGHVWVSKRGQVVAFSFLLKNSFLVNLPPITLMCGLAVARALDKLTGKKFMIKWPKDIVFEGKKVCGILCESKISGKECFSVCGIGVNLAQTAEFFEKANLPHGTSLSIITGKDSTPSPCEVAGEIANEFEKIYKSVTKESKEAAGRFISEYEKNCITVKSEIKIVKDNCEIRGIAVAVNPDGSLRVKTNERTVDVLASEASVRGVMGYL